MPAYFANLAGLFALLAIPAIIAIHLLRERSRRVTVSTLFLLEQLGPRTPRGHTIHRLQNSLPLWLQLLIALLATWLLADPRWIRIDSSQRVTVVLDTTASMAACRARVLAELPLQMAALERAAARTEWLLLSTDAPEIPLYRGIDRRAAEEVLRRWDPVLPHHDPARAFTLALLETRAGGTTLFASDRRPEALPAGITLLGYGEPIENCGLAGAETGSDSAGTRWEALVRNAGALVQERQWWFATATAQSPPERIRLAPGEVRTLTGSFPPGTEALTLHLEPDAFTLDDALPLVLAKPRALGVFIGVPEAAAAVCARVVATLAGAVKESDVTKADVAILTASPATLGGVGTAAVLIGDAGASVTDRATAGGITIERHPLVEGLVWDGLLSPGPGATEPLVGDTPLVWQGGKPLVFLRQIKSHNTLVFNFPWARSNADRLPATVLLLGRFLADVQGRKEAPSSSNFETNQRLEIAGGGVVQVTTAAGAATLQPGALRAPLKPGFFEVRRGSSPLLTAAAHFGDSREGSFTNALLATMDFSRTSLVRRENTVGDALAPLWLGLIALALLGSWAAQVGPSARRAPGGQLSPAT